MSGQYPGFNSPLGGHRGGQFNPQHISSGVGAAGSGQPMIGYQGGMMGQPQQGSGMPVMGGGGGAAGMSMSGHVQQQMMQQQQMQMQQQQQQQQMGPGPQMSMAGPVGMMAPNAAAAAILQQQMAAANNTPQQQTASTSGGGSQPSTSQAATSGMLAISQPNTHKEINIVALSRLGQETVQDITSRFQEIFAALKIIQPTANRDNNTEKKVQEYFRTIRLLFKRVRIIYEKCNDGYPQGMEYTHVESLIPYRDETDDHRIEPSQCEEYRKALQENQELIETVKLKNRQLRVIIDLTRIIIWEINTMLSMRRS